MRSRHSLQLEARENQQGKLVELQLPVVWLPGDGATIELLKDAINILVLHRRPVRFEAIPEDRPELLEVEVPVAVDIEEVEDLSELLVGGRAAASHATGMLKKVEADARVAGIAGGGRVQNAKVLLPLGEHRHKVLLRGLGGLRFLGVVETVEERARGAGTARAAPLVGDQAPRRGVVVIGARHRCADCVLRQAFQIGDEVKGALVQRTKNPQSQPSRYWVVR